MSRGLFCTVCALSFLVNPGRIGFAPLLEPPTVTYVVGPGTGTVLAASANGLIVLGGAMGALSVTDRIPGSPTR